MRRKLALSAVAVVACVLAVVTRPAAADVFTNVPEAAGYSLVYTLPVPTVGGFNGATVPYSVNNSATISRGSFDRVAYYMELDTGTGTQWVYASVNAFTDDARRIGVPYQSGGFFQQVVTGVNVASNVGGIATGTNLSGFNLEFWRTNYAQANSANVPNASGATGNRNYDWGDQPTAGGYGSMQLHNNGASQPVFAFNRWGANQGTVDIGIGTNPNTANGVDYTFQQNGATYTTKNIQVLVRPTATPISHRIEIMPLGDSITDGSGAAGGYRTQLQQRLTASGLNFEFVGSQVTNPSTAISATGRVTHEGHGGYRIDQINAGLDTAGSGAGTDNNGFWFNPTVQPDFILLHIGTNDFGQNFSTATAINRLDALITKITSQRPNANLIVTNLLTRTDNATAEAGIETQFNPFVPGVVQQHAANGEKVFFLDMNSQLNPLTDLVDGLHPNQAGYDKMGNAFFTAIQAVPEPSAVAAMAVPLCAGLLARRRRGRRADVA